VAEDDGHALAPMTAVAPVIVPCMLALVIEVLVMTGRAVLVAVLLPRTAIVVAIVRAGAACRTAKSDQSKGHQGSSKRLIHVSSPSQVRANARCEAKTTAAVLNAS